MTRGRLANSADRPTTLANAGLDLARVLALACLHKHGLGGLCPVLWVNSIFSDFLNWGLLAFCEHGYFPITVMTAVHRLTVAPPTAVVETRVGLIVTVTSQVAYRAPVTTLGIVGLIVAPPKNELPGEIGPRFELVMMVMWVQTM